MKELWDKKSKKCSSFKRTNELFIHGPVCPKKAFSSIEKSFKSVEYLDSKWFPDTSFCRQ